jgi:ACS family hexuronate transporter-like MFS transporter
MFGSIGGMLVATATGWILQATHSYVTIFVCAGGAYLVALGVIHALAPRLAPLALDAAEAR